MTARLTEEERGIAKAFLAGSALHEDLGEQTKTCEAHGDYQAIGKRILITRPPKDIWTKCPGCVAAEAAAERAEADRREAEAQRARAERMLEQTLLPARFSERTLASFNAETDGQKRALRIATEFVANFDVCLRRGSSLIFSGLPGTGKSHLAAGIMLGILPQHIGIYVTMMDLIRMLRDTWRKDSDRSQSDVLNQLADAPLLVIDEVGVQYGTDGERTLFFDVMDRRYRERMPTILLTNQGMEEFKVTVGERVYDRLTEVARWVPFDWKSYRATARREFQQ